MSGRNTFRFGFRPFAYVSRIFGGLYSQMGTASLGVLTVFIVLFQVRLLAVVVMAATHFPLRSPVLKMSSKSRFTSHRETIRLFSLKMICLMSFSLRGKENQ